MTLGSSSPLGPEAQRTNPVSTSASLAPLPSSRVVWPCLEEWDPEIPDKFLGCAQIPGAHPMPWLSHFSGCVLAKLWKLQSQTPMFPPATHKRGCGGAGSLWSRSRLPSHSTGQKNLGELLRSSYDAGLSFESRPDFCSCSGGRAYLSSLWLTVPREARALSAWLCGNRRIRSVVQRSQDPEEQPEAREPQFYLAMRREGPKQTSRGTGPSQGRLTPSTSWCRVKWVGVIYLAKYPVHSLCLFHNACLIRVSVPLFMGCLGCKVGLHNIG